MALLTLLNAGEGKNQQCSFGNSSSRSQGTAVHIIATPQNILWEASSFRKFRKRKLQQEVTGGKSSLCGNLRYCKKRMIFREEIPTSK